MRIDANAQKFIEGKGGKYLPLHSVKGVKIRDKGGRPKKAAKVKGRPPVIPSLGESIPPPPGYVYENWRDVLTRVVNEKNLAGMSLRERVARRVAKMAEAGIPWAVQWIAERMDGKAPQAILVSQDRPNPLLQLSDSQLDSILQIVKSDDSPKLIEGGNDKGGGVV